MFIRKTKAVTRAVRVADILSIDFLRHRKLALFLGRHLRGAERVIQRQDFEELALEAIAAVLVALVLAARKLRVLLTAVAVATDIFDLISFPIKVGLLVPARADKAVLLAPLVWLEERGLVTFEQVPVKFSRISTTLLESLLGEKPLKGLFVLSLKRFVFFKFNSGAIASEHALRIRMRKTRKGHAQHEQSSLDDLHGDRGKAVSIG
jgi:hypothetical protein